MNSFVDCEQNNKHCLENASYKVRCDLLSILRRTTESDSKTEKQLAE